ncbi:uncharacterized protein LAESUDRAFT_475508 [Laetiporus sulphureus 93-53]|uniref:Uncharacterized protein n=1 Tax=Laetiporus sulphureus 93-53 TaxID=1314785 RepID=A0A165GD15_9APHY|nr:uncharacterized protein LAESUDRAFT_475508 [Laetiporus sulphureus 93-53]KZT10181.1 hypothetical protein LAESUDRAFT_475508 [Laetiporus sulphureus 93-53]
MCIGEMKLLNFLSAALSDYGTLFTYSARYKGFRCTLHMFLPTPSPSCAIDECSVSAPSAIHLCGFAKTQRVKTYQLGKRKHTMHKPCFILHVRATFGSILKLTDFCFSFAARRVPQLLAAVCLTTQSPRAYRPTSAAAQCWRAASSPDKT